MCRMFYYLMGFFLIFSASLVPKWSIIRYLRCHLGFCNLLWCHFGIYWSKSRHHQSCFGIFGLFDSWHLGIFDIFGILASWDSKVDIIRDQRCLGFGIFALLWCLLLGLMMPKCLKCQKCQDAKKRCQNQKMNESQDPQL